MDWLTRARRGTGVSTIRSCVTAATCEGGGGPSLGYRHVGLCLSPALIATDESEDILLRI